MADVKKIVSNLKPPSKNKFIVTNNLVAKEEAKDETMPFNDLSKVEAEVDILMSISQAMEDIKVNPVRSTVDAELGKFTFINPDHEKLLPENLNAGFKD